MHQQFGDDVLFIGMAGRGERVEAELFVSDHGLDGFQHTFDAAADSWSEFDQYLVPAYVFIDDDGTVTSHVGALGLEGATSRLAALVDD